MTLAGIFSFSASTYSFAENAGLVSVKIVRTGGASGAVTVLYRLANPTQATAANDKNFRLIDATYQVQFDEGQREGLIQFAIIDDAIYEAKEFFFLEIASLLPTKASDPSASVAKIGTPRIAIVYIADDGDAGVFNFATPFTFCREDNGTALLTIVRNQGSSSSSYIPVNLVVTTLGTTDGSNATEGGSLAFDYLAKSDKLNWANGETKKTLAVKVFNNARYESQTRAVKVKMTSVEGGASIGTQLETWIYIVDDRDAGTLSFGQSHYEVLENSGSVTIDIVRTGVLDPTSINTYASGVVTVDVATFGGTVLPGRDRYDLAHDYGVVRERGCTHVSPCTAPAGVAYTPLQATTISFADGETLKQVTIPILDDDLFQAPDRVFKVTLQRATGGAHIGVDYEHPSEWFGYRSVFLALESRSAVLLDNVGTIVTIKDDGDAAVLVSKASVSTSEIGQVDTFQVRLNALPSAAVTVAFAFDTALLKLSTTSLTFTATTWNEKQNVQVAAIANSKSEGVHKTYISLSCSSADTKYASPFRAAPQVSGSVLGVGVYTQKRGEYDTGNAEHEYLWLDTDGVMTAPQAASRIMVSIFDDKHAGVALTPETVRHRSGVNVPDSLVSVRRNGHSATVEVSLTSEPAADVRVTLTPEALSGIAVEPATLDFSVLAWNVPAKVKIAAVEIVGQAEPQTVQFSSVAVTVSSAGDPFYIQGSKLPRRIFVQRYPPAQILLDSSVASIREGAGDNEKALYSLRLGSEPMHWEPSGSVYSPHELVLSAEADTTLSFPPLSSSALGKATTITAAGNSSQSTASRMIRSLGVLRFKIYPDVDTSTGSNQVGSARLRLYRVSGGENGGLGGIRVGATTADVDSSSDWDESTLQSQCTDTLENSGACSVLSAGVGVPSFFPPGATIYTVGSQLDADAAVTPAGAFSDVSNAYVGSSSWLDIDVTYAVNKFLSRVPRSSSAKAITFLMHSRSASEFTYDGVDEVVFASREYADSAMQPQLRLTASGVVNLALKAQVAQSCPGNAKAAIDGLTSSRLSTSSSYALSALPFKYPWWEADLGALRALEKIVVTVKKKLSAASMDDTHIITSFWVFLSTMSLALNNNGVTEFTRAQASAPYMKQFNVTTRSFAASDADTITFVWNVNGEVSGTFGADRFVGAFAKPVEARYVLIQVEGENNLMLNEVEVYQLAFASSRVSIGGLMSSVAQSRLGKNQLQYFLPELRDSETSECDARTDVCRRELVFSSGNWQTPQLVGVKVVDDLIAMGDHDIFVMHTPESNDPDFDEVARCGVSTPSSESIACKNALFNASSVKAIRVLEDDENKILLSTHALDLVEGSQSFPTAPVFVRPAQLLPRYVRCSGSAALITAGANDVRNCAVSFSTTSSVQLEACIANTSALPLEPGSAWMMAGFEAGAINVSRIDVTVLSMLGSKYIKRFSVWWSTSQSLVDSSSSNSLLDISRGWEKIKSVDVAMKSSGSQVFTIDKLELFPVQAVLISLEQAYDGVTQCVVAPQISIFGFEPVPFPLPIRGDLKHVNSVPPLRSHLSRMHLPGKTSAVQVQLTSEPVGDVIVAAVLEDNNSAVVVYDAANQSAVPDSVRSLLGATYETGDAHKFTMATAIKFTAANWNVPQALTFAAVDDNFFNGNRTFVVRLAASSTDTRPGTVPYQVVDGRNLKKGLTALSTSLSYASADFIVSTQRATTWPRRYEPAWTSAAGAITVAVVDDDLPGVTVSTSVVRVPESGPVGNFSVFLDSAPFQDVTVTVSYEPDASLLHVDPLQLTFTTTNWYAPQLVFVRPVPNDVYDGEQPFTVDYSNLISKAKKPALRLTVQSADLSYDNARVGGNEFDRTTRYASSQSVQAVMLDDDTGCLGEYACQNAGTCVTSASGNQCACRENFGMRDCSAACKSKRNCAFSRITLRLKCLPQTPSAICSSAFSPSTLASTLYRMLVNNEFTAANGQKFTKLSLAPMSQLLYVVNSSRVECTDISHSGGCLAVSLDVNLSRNDADASESASSSAVLQKLEGFLSSGSLKTEPIFAELMTSEPQYPADFGATIAIWIFIGFCALCVAAVGSLFTARLVRAKSSHVTPQLERDDDVAASNDASNPSMTSPRST